MDREYEVKIKVGELNNIKSNIVKLGGTHLGTYREDDYYVDLRNCILAENKDIVFRIRIRDVGGVLDGELTVKGPRKTLQAIRVRDELNIKIDKPYELVKFLDDLSFKMLKVSKTREVYYLKGFKIFLDEVHGLGTFVEVELGSVEDLRTSEMKLAEMLKELEVVGEFVIKSYAEMVMERVNHGE